MTYKIIIQPIALKQLQGIKDRRVRLKIRDRIDGLSQTPDLQGKPLISELKGYFSLRAVGQRYRIIYKVDAEKVIVFVVAVGIRKGGDKNDIYKLAKRLLRLKLLEPDQ